MKKLIVFFAALSMVLGFAVTAAMADADLYGSVRFRTYWADKDDAYSGTGFDDEDLEWRIGKLSRWGVNYKSGNITGKVELDARDLDGDEGSSEFGELRVRHLYGEWDFGMGKLLIGQTFNPCTVYLSGLGYYSGGVQPFHGTGLDYFRTSQMRLTFDNFMIAFLTPDTEEKYDDSGEYGEDGDIDITLPRIEARYSFNFDPVKLDVMGGWQTYDVVDDSDNEESIDSYFVGLYANANFGAAYVKGLINYRQNGGNYGIWTMVNETALITDGDVEDVTALGYAATFGYKFSDKVTVEASYAASQSENDDTDLFGGDPEDDAQVYSLLVKYSPAPGVIIQPELIYDDREESDYIGADDDQGDALIFGVFWMINFK